MRIEKIANPSITSPNGFIASGIHSGIKKRKKDLALVYSNTPCQVAGMFTTNLVEAPPNTISRKIVATQSPVKGILINSGNANACTGESGYMDALSIQSSCAQNLRIQPNELLLASTGVIGQRLQVQVIEHSLKKLISHLSVEGGNDAAEAILTTDTQTKEFGYKVFSGEGEFTIAGMCKGSGMIHPRMATMLAFITCDADIPSDILSTELRNAVNRTFNRITVDGDTSTNDMVLVLCNSTANLSINELNRSLFSQVLEMLCRDMARSIIKDGEGATKMINIVVEGAESESDADLIAGSIANSPLVKTAFFGCDANWGRIIAAVGRSGVKINPADVRIWFDDLIILDKNHNVLLDEDAALKVMKKDEITLKINVSMGEAFTHWMTCDLTNEYIRINAKYRT